MRSFLIGAYGRSVAKSKRQRRQQAGGGARPAGAAPKTWLVEYHSEAVVEFWKRTEPERKGILTIVDLLRQNGTKLAPPHMKPLKDEKKVRELRPSNRKLLVRPLYFQYDARTFKIVAIAPESMVDPSGFDAAVERAKKRAKRDYDVDI